MTIKKSLIEATSFLCAGVVVAKDNKFIFTFINDAGENATLIGKSATAYTVNKLYNIEVTKIDSV